jgi:hypothetical protein
VPWQVSFLAWVSGIGIYVWSYIDIKRDGSAHGRLELIESAVRRNQARVLRIRANEVVEFEEEEDEGATYAFQLEDDRIVVIAGQDFYPSAKFPNTDFSLVDILAEDGTVVEGVIAKEGIKLKPSRVIGVDVWRKLKVPYHLETLAGKLDSLEQLLAQ